VIYVSIRKPEEKVPPDSAQAVPCFRHEDDNCPRCHGSGYRPVKHCAECGEPAGSISARTGAPLITSREDGAYYHVRCDPHFRLLDTHWSCLERMED
jgi:hypothetical protein